MSDAEHYFSDRLRIWARRDPEDPSEPAADVGHRKSKGPSDRQIRELDLITGNSPAKTRSVPLRLLVPLLVEAQKRNATWLSDFADDVALIDADLHDVLLAFDQVRRGTSSRIDQNENETQPNSDRRAA